MAKWSDEKMADLTRKLADTAIDYKQRWEDIDAAFTNLHREYDRRGDRIAELEVKLAQVTAAYRIEVMQRGPWVSQEDFDRHIREITGDHDE